MQPQHSSYLMAESGTSLLSFIIHSQIARNRLGLNDVIHEKAKAEAEAERAKKAKEAGEKKRKKT